VTEIRRSRSGRASASVTAITIILPRPGTAEQAAALAHCGESRVGPSRWRLPRPDADLPAEPVACDENGDVEPAERGFGERVVTVELA
jgi:hypothetical protein